MSIFRTYLKIVARHKVYMIIYLVILNLLGIMYAAVLSALQGLDKDLLLVAKDDELGRTLESLSVPERKRAPKRREVGI